MAPRRPRSLVKSRPRAAVGRPQVEFKPAYPDMLVEHLKKGMTFESFGAEVGVHRDTLYEWVKRHPEFADAKKLAQEHQERFYVQLGLSIASGQLRRLKREGPVMVDGKVYIDPETGRPMMEKEYETAKVNPVAWIYLCKNVLKWRDEKHLQVGGDANGAPIITRSMTQDERLAEIERLQKMRLLCQNNK